MAKTNATRILIETIVRQTIKGIKDNPERGIRRLVDMAQEFSGGRFQKYFFTIAQTMLADENCAYYGILRQMVSYADTERLVKFGMNLGYNGCTKGARTIREIESEKEYNIPWTVALDMDAAGCRTRYEEYKSVIRQGQKLGIYVWQIHEEGSLSAVLELAGEFPDSAFLLFCHEDELDEEALDALAELPNLMPVICFERTDSSIWETLRNRGIFYSVSFQYGADNAREITSGDFFCEAQQVHPVFTVLAASPGYPEETHSLVYQCICEFREGAKFETFPWESVYDSSLVDGIISTDACVVRFGADGSFYTYYDLMPKEGVNLFEDGLEGIFRRCLPKASLREEEKGSGCDEERMNSYNYG